MGSDLVHKIREFAIGTTPRAVEEFMNTNGVIDPVLHVGHRDVVERYISHRIKSIDDNNSRRSDLDEYAHNHVAVRHTVYIVHYKEPANG